MGRHARYAVAVGLIVATAGCNLGLTTRPNETPANQSVILENSWTQSVEIHVRVLREATNETVHESTYSLDPAAERTVYNTTESALDDVEKFTVAVTVRNTTERVTIETSQCYHHAYASVNDRGELSLVYAVC